MQNYQRNRYRHNIVIARISGPLAAAPPAKAMGGISGRVLTETSGVPLQNGISIRPGAGGASLEAEEIPIFDYETIGNALFGGGPQAVPGLVSFKVSWSGVGERLSIRNTDPIYGGFAAELKATRRRWNGQPQLVI